jgi:SAM-dependent methyltransferase
MSADTNRTHEAKVARWIPRGAIGVEIGAWKSPVPGLTPVYVDRYAEFGGEPCRADYQGDATALPFHDHSLDYVVTSHVLEHVANPVAALAEWCRVLRPGGIIYLLVPDRRLTWDRFRKLTPVDHLLEDFARGTTAVDATHIEDFVRGVDWTTFSPDTPPADVPRKQQELMAVYQAAVAAGQEINIHFHVFEPGNLRDLISRLQPRLHWELIDECEHFPASAPNGYLVILRVRKTWTERVRATWQRLMRGSGVRSALLPSAKPFIRPAAATG